MLNKGICELIMCWDYFSIVLILKKKTKNKTINLIQASIHCRFLEHDGKGNYFRKTNLSGEYGRLGGTSTLRH